MRAWQRIGLAAAVSSTLPDADDSSTAETSFDRHGQRYDRKTVAVGSGAPEISLRTASGSITVRRQR